MSCAGRRLRAARSCGSPGGGFGGAVAQRGGFLGAPAGGQVIFGVSAERRRLGTTKRDGERTPLGEAASDRRIDQGRRRTLDRYEIGQIAMHVGKGMREAHRVGM